MRSKRTNQTTNQPTNQPTNRPTNQPTNHPPTNHPINQQTIQLTHPPTHPQRTNQLTNQPQHPRFRAVAGRGQDWGDGCRVLSSRIQCTALGSGWRAQGGYGAAFAGGDGLLLDLVLRRQELFLLRSPLCAHSRHYVSAAGWIRSPPPTPFGNKSG